MSVNDEPESLKSRVLSWTGAIVVFGLFVWMPKWSMLIIFICALLLTFFPGAGLDEPDDLAFYSKVICFGAAMLCAEALFWWMFSNKNEISLRNALIPHVDMPFGFRLTLIGWAAIFLGLLHICRAIFRAVFTDNS
jgi:hypothetical protein